MRIISVVGARPQFIKAAVVSRALVRQGIPEVLVHTGQHYDPMMSRVFFDEMLIPQPHYNLDVGSGSHGRQTGEILKRLEPILEKERPDRVLIYGDTNSTLAAALAASKLCIPVAHVEAGLRSYNRRMPEEINRILADHIADLLFCPTMMAVANLRKEGIVDGVHNVGDVMYDAVLFYADLASQQTDPLKGLGIAPREYFLATIHRAENTDHPKRLRDLLEALSGLEKPVLLPLHPRTRKEVHRQSITIAPTVILMNPASYFQMIRLEQQAAAILTDSGGVQKEAFFFGVPCLTLREETEWVETVESGWNHLVGADPLRIARAVRGLAAMERRRPPSLFGDGHAAEKICNLIKATV
ncbi:MAG: UDP-N-acetylglucosamine 2-epimerase (non-hydrolyzing) [Acidobacteria bacterium]|nr:UDP-N-acetylglucosamine 2-epimerase (non-hydrolyzing) [Acidobacteriota bacterium]MBI3655276.1 UDP-N-acetylglucosamine 2-epimerase (non-hydrolyzing) [Acidobacteriota bacterium]